MFTEINLQLEDARQGVFRLRKIESMIKELKNEQTHLEQRIAVFRRVLDRENLDVKRLEQMSLAAVFYSILGSLEERVEKERREALAAKLKYDQAVSELEDINKELSALSSERMKYQDYQRRYDNLFAQKKGLLVNGGTESAQVLLSYAEQMDETKNRMKEIIEAISAGQSVVSCLEDALNSLGSAKNWGVWDMLGGGLIAGLAKHSHIDAAKKEAERAHTLMRRFKTELADVAINCDIVFETGGFGKFADFFFDGLIADWFMQSKIHNSHESVSRAKSEVQGVLAKLNTLKDHETSNLEKIDKQIRELVASY